MSKFDVEVKDVKITKVSKEEMEKLMADIQKDLYYEPTEEDTFENKVYTLLEDIEEMERCYLGKKKNKEYEEYREFIQNSKKEYDFEERGEI